MAQIPPATPSPVDRALALAVPLDLPDATLSPIGFDALAGWAQDDHKAALDAFRISCRAVVEERAAIRSGISAPDHLKPVCRLALDLGRPNGAAARQFFETHFQPYRVETPGRALLTGYFEPEIDGSLVPTASHSHPLLARPADLVPVTPQQAGQALDGLSAARRVGGRLEAFPTRGEIEVGALGSEARPLLYVRDEVEAFTIHVQGSARIRLPDGRRVRVAYDGRNGHPYSSIGRIIVQEGHLPLAEASMDRLITWMRANPDDGRRIMRMNRSFIFFRLADDLDPARGPVGGASVQLTPGRSVAIDRAIWPYGLPVFLGADLGDVPAAPAVPAGRFERLAIMQDTGSAIVGPIRADLFVGSGAEAGLTASRLRHSFSMVVLWPKPVVR